MNASARSSSDRPGPESSTVRRVLPPSRLPTYYARHSWPRLTRRMIFATDWPGIPGIAANARAVAALLPDDETRDLVLAGNAMRVYGLQI